MMLQPFSYNTETFAYDAKHVFTLIAKTYKGPSGIEHYEKADEQMIDHMAEAKKWCEDQFGPGVHVMSERDRGDARWTYSSMRVFIYDQTDAFNFRLRWA